MRYLNWLRLVVILVISLNIFTENLFLKYKYSIKNSIRIDKRYFYNFCFVA